MCYAQSTICHNFFSILCIVSFLASGAILQFIRCTVRLNAPALYVCKSSGYKLNKIIIIHSVQLCTSACGKKSSPPLSCLVWWLLGNLLVSEAEKSRFFSCSTPLSVLQFLTIPIPAKIKKKHLSAPPPSPLFLYHNYMPFRGIKMTVISHRIQNAMPPNFFPSPIIIWQRTRVTIMVQPTGATAERETEKKDCKSIENIFIFVCYQFFFIFLLCVYNGFTCSRTL